ncbi:MAG: HAMP domain-containing sensor histidine kinase [Syntrophales bacterium]|nr:HAMP domain-containing sensor histidine kinase [Syntrophales bacterium]
MGKEDMAPKALRNKSLRNSIQATITLIIILTVTVIFAGFAFYEYFVTSTDMNKDFENLAEYIVNQQSKSLSLPLWYLDTEAVKDVMSSAMIEKQVHAVLIRDESGILYGEMRDNNLNIIKTSKEISGEYYVKEKEISKNDEKLGTVEVYLTPEFMQEKLYDTTVRMIIAILILNISLVSVLLFSIRKSVTLPVRYIAEGIRTIASGNLDRSIHSERKDEIGQLASDAESMRLTIKENLELVRKQGEELNTRRDHLEVMVKERTNELEEKTAELKNANERLQELDHLKSMFIASMSHELRTPLNSIIGFTGIILQGMTGEITGEQRDQLQRVYGSAKHLLALINDVIDISKIEAGKFEVHVAEFDLDGIIKEAISSLKPEIDNKGLGLEIRLPPNLQLKTDRKRLLQCILNFLSNAVKFTKKGKIEVTAREIDGMMEIAVKDTGIGIKEEDVPRLFESFVRLDSDLKIGTPGTGLGLYLTKKIATEQLKGSVSAESKYGEGSTFMLRIPKTIEGMPKMS